MFYTLSKENQTVFVQRIKDIVTGYTCTIQSYDTVHGEEDQVALLTNATIERVNLKLYAPNNDGYESRIEFFVNKQSWNVECPGAKMEFLDSGHGFVIQQPCGRSLLTWTILREKKQ